MTVPRSGSGPWIAATAPSAFEGPETLAWDAQVVIVGAGLAGASAALFLARAGARPVLLEAREDVGLAASGRHPGPCFLGLPESPHRLVGSLGAQGARELYRFTRENAELLSDIAPLARRGGLWAAADDRESADLDASVRALQSVGVPVERWERGRVAEALRSRAFGSGLFCPEEGVFDPYAAVQGIAAAAVRAGARVHVRCPALSVGHEDRGVVVRLADREIVCDALIFAANAWLPGIDPYFADKISTFREQGLALAPCPPRFAYACRSQQAYVTWRQAPSGAILFSGCRWATPHLEAGETEERTVDVVQDRLAGFVRDRFPDLAALEVTHRWSWIDARTCDGLPIIGPIPGGVRILSCAGFNGNEPGMGVRAARAVVDGLLTGTAPGVPRTFTPGRFL
jgi:glycine/D-amino acid oxidase-like deaminating enzyme